MFDSAGVDLGQPMVISCVRGLTACGVAAAAKILGKENVPVYYVSGTCVYYIQHLLATFVSLTIKILSLD